MSLHSAAGGTIARSLAPFAWAVLLIGSAAPLFLWQELAGTPAALWPSLVQAGALVPLLFALRRLPGLRPLDGLLRWLLALSVGWYLVFGILDALPAWEVWQQGVPWVACGAAATHPRWRGDPAVPAPALRRLLREGPTINNAN